MERDWINFRLLLTLLAFLPVNVAAQSEDEDTETLRTLLIVLIVSLIVVLVIILIFCICFREWTEKFFPCLMKRVTPEGQTEWYHVNKFGETNIKYARHKMAEVESTDKASLISEESNYAKITLSVPVFEETLGTGLQKKSVHVAEHEPSISEEPPKKSEAEPKKKKKRSSSNKLQRNGVDTNDNHYETVITPTSLALPPLKNRPPTIVEEETERARDSPGRANRVRNRTTHLRQAPPNDYSNLPSSSSAHPVSPFITMNSDDDLR